MLSFLPAPLIVILAIVYAVLNFAIFLPLVVVLAPIKLCIPSRRFRNVLYRLQTSLGQGWVQVNAMAIRLFTTTTLDVDMPSDFSKQGRYLLVSNHQTWLDIVLLQVLFNRKIPFLTFFLKKELLWVPLVGVACWSYEFPFMKRHSRATLEKYPEKREEDLNTTKQFCKKFKGHPISVINFLEGTRFTAEKHQKYHSQFTHLLNPKAGGIAYVLAALEDIDAIINITIAYPISKPTLLAFICNKMPQVSIRIEKIPLPAVAKGDYFHQEEDKVAFQQWVNQLWTEKDATLDNLKKHLLSAPRTWTPSQSPNLN